jgi:spore germination protein GerM
MSEKRQDAFRQVLFAAWAMLTLVLFFCVVLLVKEMVDQGHDPLAVSTAPPPPPPSVAETEASEDMVRTAQLYFADAEGRVLLAETRQLPHHASTTENCREVLDALQKGPRGHLTPILPPSAEVRALFLLESGELVIDFSIEFLSEQHRSASAEALMIYGIVNTLAQKTLKGQQEPAVQCVRFLVEGSSPEQSLPGHGHLDLSHPIPPNTDWLGAPEDAQPTDA